MFRRATILIPALNPDKKLIDYVRELISRGFEYFIIVDDGSSDDESSVFDEIYKLSGQGCDIQILRHAINLGKGRGLKTGINYYLTNLNTRYQSKGVICADSDGQHHPDDVEKIDNCLLETEKDALVLGCRDFELDNIPIKSRFGNKLTRGVFRFCFGRDIIDTQTGLRGFTNSLLPKLLDLSGERFEYETNVLIECVKRGGVKIQQIKIHTIYENDNKGTHFDPIVDSIKIYRLILARFAKYFFSSLTSFFIDCLLFWILCRIFSIVGDNKILIATIGARIVSSIYNYFINKTIVFEYKDSIGNSLLRYFVLCIATMLASGFAVRFIYGIIGKNEVLIKCCVDSILFMCNYVIQQKVVFRNKEEQK